RVQRIQVYRDVDGCVEGDAQVIAHMAHLDDLDTEPARLRALMPAGRANPDLHQAIRESILHDPRERTRVRETVTLELVVEVRVRVDVKDRELRRVRPNRAE